MGERSGIMLMCLEIYRQNLHLLGHTTVIFGIWILRETLGICKNFIRSIPPYKFGVGRKYRKLLWVLVINIYQNMSLLTYH